MPHRSYTPPASFFERTRCTIAGFLIPIVWGLTLLTLHLLPRTHPFRIFAADRMRTTRDIGVRACAIHSTGRAVPTVVPAVLSLWCLLDATSRKVDGPFEWTGWDLDERIRIFERIQHLLAEHAPLFAGLLG